MADPLPEQVRARFAAPAHAGPLAPGPGPRRAGEAGEQAEGAWVRLELAGQAGRIRDARFLAYGDPWLIAAADWLCEQLQGRPWPEAPLPGPGEALPGLGGPLDWARALAVGRDRLTRLLVVEDALRRALAAAPAAAPG